MSPAPLCQSRVASRCCDPQVFEREEKGEKQVRYLDGVQIEHWLDDCPALAANYARHELGLAPQVGARSIAGYWDWFSNRFEPALAEVILLCEREAQIKSLLEQLSAPSGKVALQR